MVVPGTYQVAIAKRVDGVTTPIGQPQRFEVRMLDGNVPPRAPQVLAFQQQVGDLQRAVAGANALAGELSTRVQALRRAVQETPGADDRLGAELRTIEQRLRAVRESFTGDPTIARRQEPTAPSLLGRMNLMAQTARSLGAPTATQRRQFDIVSADFEKVLGQVRAIVDTDLRRVETAAEAAGVPWTPGRMPEWRGSAVGGAGRGGS